MSSTKSLPSPTGSDENKENFSNRRPSEKAAAILALLDEKSLSSLSGKVAEKHRDQLVNTASSMRSIPQAELRRIAHEFAIRLSKERNAVRGSDSVAQRLQSSLFVPEFEPMDFAAPEVFDGEDDIGEDGPFWERIANLSMRKLINYFEDKSATVLAIALQNLPADTASELSAELDDNLVKDSVLLIATAGKLNPLAVEAVESMLETALLAKSDDGADAEEETEGNPNADTVADLLNRLTNKRREKILESLKATLPDDEMGEIASKVLSFEALEYRLPRNAIPVLFREVAENDILVAIKYAAARNDPVAEYLLGNISQRLATTYREKMEGMGEIGEEKGEKAQSSVICKLLMIVEQGSIKLLDYDGEGGDD